MLYVSNQGIDYSILICTYNPDERLLQRCLNAVLQLQCEGFTREIILVDNNSAVPLGSLPYIQSFLAMEPALKLISVKEQGLVHARIGGFEAARGKYIVFFDDDNEPAADYLLELNKLFSAYPEVAVWGPGNIWVDFIDGIDRRIEDFARKVCQERHEERLAYANVPQWQDCYPFGTGLCISALFMRRFVAAVQGGEFTLPGRKGNSLSSGEDTQMVLFCIRGGASAGVAPALKLHHIIPAKRANHRYIKRLVYHTRVVYETCMVQVFPAYRARVEENYITAATFVRRTFKLCLRTAFGPGPLKRFDLVYYIASVNATYRVLDKPVPSFVRGVLKLLNVT
jgi:glycosyltransferase involved in cell wall biosynthesis